MIPHDPRDPQSYNYDPRINLEDRQSTLLLKVSQ